MARLRAGLIGLGMMGRHHARVLREVDGVELVAVADPGGDPHKVAGGLDVLTGAHDLVARGIDMAVVAVPTALHEDVALTFADAGVHVLVEKPLAPDTKSAQTIADAFTQRGLVGCVGHIERYNPALQELKRRLADGAVGDIYQIVTRRQGPFPARIADVGVVKDLATHDIDLTAWVTGREFTAVSARTAHRSGREHEDLVAAVGSLTGGVVTNHLVNWLTPFKERLTVVTGERGAFVADTLQADLTYFANGTVATEWDSVASFRGVSEGDMVRPAIPKREPLRVEHEAFRDAVLGLDADVVSMSQGLQTVRVAEAVLEAAATGRVVDVT